MNPNITLLGQMISFAILIWFTVKFIWPPLMAAIEERQQKIAEGLAAADNAQKNLAQSQDKANEELKAARAKANEIIDQAHQRANQIIRRRGDDVRVRQPADRRGAGCRRRLSPLGMTRGAMTAPRAPGPRHVAVAGPTCRS